MIITELYNGQGLGNQLACYVATRVFSLDNGYDFGIKSPEKFKAGNFMNLDFGCKVTGGKGPEGGPPKTLPEGMQYYYAERKIIHLFSGADIRTYDKNLVNIKDGTKIDGLMQDEQYIFHRKDEIKKWLQVKEEYECYDYADDNTCVINFRGGEYVRHPEFFLRKEYWEDAVRHMRKINPNFRFIVITEDVSTAKKFFPDFGVFHFSIAKDYVVVKNAHYLIMSNSSFAWFPAWLSESLKFCIAPKYWGRHNVSDGYWSLGYNITKGWNYLDREGNLNDYDTCLKELKAYMERHKDYYQNQAPVFMPAPKGMKAKAKQLLPKSARRAARAVIYKMQSAKNFVRTSLELKKEKVRQKAWVSKIELDEYKKRIKVYDLFYLLNELDLLEIRLNILNDYVDQFVIVESTETFSGMPHELQYEKHKERFAKWKDKITYYVVNDFPKDTSLLEMAKNNSNVGAGEHYWVREFYQKESAKKALAKLNLNDTDVVFVSDLDEIWNPIKLKELTDFSKSEIIRPKQLAYYYYLNNRCNEVNGWTGTIAVQYKTIKENCLNDLRTRKKTKYAEVNDGGWHFGFMGGVEGAKRKMAEWRHPAYADWLETLEDRVNKNVDYRGRKFKYWTDESDLPDYVLKNKDKYRKLFK